ncbi:unnamed protein product [Sphacelaria rigidula]
MKGSAKAVAVLVVAVSAKVTAFFVSPVAKPGGVKTLASTATMTVSVDKPFSPRRLAKMKAREERAARARDAQAVDTTNAPVTALGSHEEYMHALSQNEESLMVVKFYAPWCRSCKAMDLKYRRLALENKDVKFYEVDVAAAAPLKEALGVTSVPTVKMYAGAVGQVASFTCGPRKVSELERKMNLCKDVPGLLARVSKGTGMMEMVAEMDNNDTILMSSSSVSDVDKMATSTAVPVSAPDRSPESVGLISGLMEKLARQEQLARALAEAQMSELPLCAAAV